MALQIIRNNIINVEADAIVNTANPKVAVGKGVDLAIYEAAGEETLASVKRSRHVTATRSGSLNSSTASR